MKWQDRYVRTIVACLGMLLAILILGTVAIVLWVAINVSWWAGILAGIALVLAWTLTFDWLESR